MFLRPRCGPDTTRYCADRRRFALSAWPEGRGISATFIHMSSSRIHISLTDNGLIKSRLPVRLADKRLRESSLALLGELERAVIVADEALPAGAVALRSVVELEDLDSGERERYTLVLGTAEEAVEAPLSVFSPLGTALIGYRAGDELAWRMPGGVRRLRILSVG
jgi:regulator of nucleoside diphosphate kinase